MSANKAKGSQFERDVVGFLRDNGCPEAARIYATGQAADQGDIDGVAGFALQCKNRAGIDLAAYVDEANHQASNRGDGHLGAAVVKRRTRGAASAYVVMDLATFARLLART